MKLSTRRTGDLELLRQLADVADGISLPYFASGGAAAWAKSDGSPVTAADQAVELAIREVLGAERPGELVFGEELGGQDSGGEDGVGREGPRRRWIVDPIDGTVNFVAGRPEWSTLLAVETDGAIATGMISAPALGRRWWATRSGGAWTSAPVPQGSTSSPDSTTSPRWQQPERLQVSAVAALDAATVAIWPLSERVPPERVAAGRRLIDSGATGGPLSDWPAACHGAALVAAGVLDVFFHMAGAPWDFAAAVPLVEEAGGTVSDLHGGRDIAAGAAVYTNGLLHAEVLDLLRSLLPF